ncbi:MAG: DUF2325 domain-containing protein [Beijerinckiaceae bacterium]|nr:DUF2325 domain-containing protein [Beijerinckiaceae bacterium]
MRDLSQYDIHTLGVRYAATNGVPSKLLNKALDEKHAGTIKRLQRAASEDDLRDAWAHALKDGSVEASYWAISTHPLASEDFFAQVFGDVHMLSHLAGSANRADIRRLSELDAEREGLRAEIARLRAQVAGGWSRRDRELQDLRDALARQLAGASSGGAADHASDGSTLERLVADLHKRIVHERERVQKLSEQLVASRDEAADLRAQLSGALKESAALRQEVEELEERFDDEDTGASPLSGKTILYVGGLGKGVKFIRAAIEKLGCNFIHHDGGMEQTNMLLRGHVGRADIVLVPLDYVSHDAALACKRFATQADKRFVPLPHAGVGSVLRALRELRLSS